jgi:hypothetical protein
MHLISQIYSSNEALHVSDSSSAHLQAFFTVHTAIGICHTGLLTACEQIGLEERTHIAVLFKKFMTDRHGCQLLCHHLRSGAVKAVLGSRL